MILIAPIMVGFVGYATHSASFGLINGAGNFTPNLIVALIDGVIGRGANVEKDRANENDDPYKSHERCDVL